MDHLGACVGLLVVVGDSYGVELGAGVVTFKYATRVLPCDGRSCFDLCPTEASILVGDTTFGNKVVDSTFAVLVARVPVLYGGVFYFCILVHNYLYDGSVQLVFIAHRCGTSFEVTKVCSFVCNKECAFKLTRITRIDTEIGAEFHWASYAFGDIDEGSVGEYCGVEGSIVVVVGRHYGTQVALY